MTNAPEAQKLAERLTLAHEIGERVFVENRHDALGRFFCSL
ncbi:hypothetical protein N183_37410 [Sinorhizobium sp. Sb3]|nr:hypothetical protein N183_37410 [Sinorhizobium sp. Sb3]